jgi:hypothetical protein
MSDKTIVDFGFIPVSRVFLLNYRKMNISMEEAMLILHLIDHSWAADKPFPSAEHFAKVTGKSGQTIRAYLRSLSYKGYLSAVLTEAGAKSYSWEPLLGSLKDLIGTPKVNTHEVTEDKPSLVKEPSKLQNIVDIANSLSKDTTKSRTPTQTKPKQWRRIRAFEQKTPDQYNAKDLEFVMGLEWEKRWSSPPPRFFGRDLKHAKDLIGIYTPKTTSEVIAWALENWESLAERFNIKGYPSMPIFWGFRNSIFPLYIDGEMNTSPPSWGTHYDKTEEESKDSEIGW